MKVLVLYFTICTFVASGLKCYDCHTGKTEKPSNPECKSSLKNSKTVEVDKDSVCVTYGTETPKSVIRVAGKPNFCETSIEVDALKQFAKLTKVKVYCTICKKDLCNAGRSSNSGTFLKLESNFFILLTTWCLCFCKFVV